VWVNVEAAANGGFFILAGRRALKKEKPDNGWQIRL
jgi:hypothetical protein